MAINYIRPDTGEAVEKEPWTWVARYNDGTKLEQFELTAEHGAVFHSSSEIDGSRLVKLQLINPQFPTITVIHQPGATPVHFYRHRQEVEEYEDPDTKEIMHRTWQLKLWVIGFRVDKQHWLAYTDEHNNTVYSSDVKLFTRDIEA